MNPDDFNSSRHSKKTGRRKGRRAYPSKLNTGTTGGWKVAIRERDGKKYYWNETTRQTSWTKPAGFREPVTDAPSASLKGIVPDTSAASLKGVVVKNKPTSLRGIVVNSPKHTKSESDSDDSDSDDSDSTETQDSSDETTKQSASPVALTPPLSPISIEDKNRRRTDSMRLLDVMVRLHALIASYFEKSPVRVVMIRNLDSAVISTAIANSTVFTHSNISTYTSYVIVQTCIRK